MKTNVYAVLLWVVCAGPLLATDPLPPSPAPSIKLPASVTGDFGKFIPIAALTDGSTVKWVALDPGLQLLDPGLLKDPKTAIVVGQPGSYRLMAYSSVKDVLTDPAFCQVIITSPAPPPPPPDPLIVATQAAYAAETDTDKARRTAFLAAVFKGAGAVLDSATTGQEVFDVLSSAIHNPSTGFPKGGIPKVMAIVTGELAKAITAGDLTPEERAAAAALFVRLGKALSGVK